MWCPLKERLWPAPSKPSIEWIGDVIILSIGKNYDTNKLSEIMALYNSEAIKRATNVIVDIGELVSINVMGLEILMLKEKMLNPSPYSVIFCGLKPRTRSIFENLGCEQAFGKLVNFNSIDKALYFLSDTQRH